MQDEVLLEASNKNATWLKLIGLTLVIIGTFSFSNCEKLGEVITLIGALVILGGCVISRSKKL